MRSKAVGLVVVALVGCAGPRAPIPPDAAVVPPAGWRGPTTVADDVSSTWWTAFDDPVLSELVETALASNTDVAIAATRVEEARAQFRLARAQQLPAVNGELTGGRSRAVSPFGEPQLQTAGQVELAISYDLDLFGRLRYASDAARASLLASAAARDNVRLAIASSVAGGYITLRSLDARLVVLRETLDARASALKLAQRRASTGYASQLDLSQAESEYRSTEQLIPAAELAVARQENGLAVLLGGNPMAIRRAKALDDIALPVVPALVPSDLLRRRPDIAAAEQQIVAADRSLDSARAAFMPSIQLGASGGLVASTLLADPVRIFSIGGSILTPLFEGGRLHAQADLATARRDEAAFAYRRTALTAFREVEDALSAIDRDAAQERSLVLQRDSLARTLRLATNRYRAGYATYLEQLDAQRALLGAELSLVQSRGDRLLAVVSLYQALGGGWTESATREDSASSR